MCPTKNSSPKQVSSKLRVQGVLLTMLGAFCFALGPVWVRSIEDYSTVSIVFYRALIGAVFLFLWILRVPTLRQHADPRRLKHREILVLCAVGICMAATASFYFYGILHTTVAKAVLLHYTAPIFVAAASPFLLREKTSLLVWIAVCVGILGTLLIIEPQNLLQAEASEVKGLISALLSGIALAGVFLCGRYLAGSLPSMVRTMWGISVILVLLLPWGISVPPGLFWTNLPYLLLLGTVSLVLPYTLFFKAHNYVSAQASSVAALFEPVCGVLLGLVLYSEHLTWSGSLGAALVLLSIYLSSLR
ncbi:MAG: DMT family transporter [Desulfohalobiaceae bacterium]